MSQGSLSIPNQSGAGFRSDVNANLQALGTLQSGATAPTTTYAYMLWADTTAGQLKQRDASNASWIVIGTLGSTNLGLATLASPTFTGTVTIPAGASISGYLTTSSASSTYAPLASPTFTGTVTIPAGASISGYAPLASPTFTGTVTIPSGASISGYAPLSGATFTGNVSVQTSSQPQLILNSTASGSWKSNIRFQNSGTAKYEIGVDTASAGANNFYFYDSVAAANRLIIDAAGDLKFNSGYGSAAVAYGCRAWVNFNGSSAAIRGNANVSSVTRNGTGDYTVNFTTAMPDANYGVASSSSAVNGFCVSLGMVNGYGRTGSISTTSVRMFTVNNSNTSNDEGYIFVQIFR